MALLTGFKTLLKGAPDKPPVVPTVGTPVQPATVVNAATPNQPIAPPAATATTPPTAPTVVPPTPPATPMGTGGLDYANPSMKDSIMKHASQHDALKYYTTPELADDLMRNAPANQNAGAGPQTVWAKNTGDEELRTVYDVIDKHTGMDSVWTSLLWWKRKPAIQLRRELEDQATRHLVTSYNRELAGAPVLPHADPRVEDIVNAYRTSGFAKNSLKRQADSGMDVKGIQQSDNYTPLSWNHHKIVKFTGNADDVLDDVAEAFGQQIARQYPGLVRVAKLKPLMIGRSFLRTQKDSATSVNASAFRGTTADEMAAIMREAGVGSTEINQVIANITPDMKEAGKLKHHKNRMRLDTDQVYTTKSGKPFRLGDFMDTNMGSQLDNYNNVTAHRIGMAKVGFTDEASLRTRFDAELKKFEGDPVKYKEAKEALDNIYNDVMGRPTGAAMSDLMRSATTVAQSLFLKRSGLFNLVDPVRSAQRFGYAKVAVKFLPAFKGVMSSTPMTPGVARKLNDVISGRLISEGRMRSVINLHEDNFAGAVTLGHEWTRVAGQTTRFLNMSEWLRRQHINMITSIQADYLESISKATGTLKGEAAKAKEYFNAIGVDDAMINKLKGEINQHGLYTDDWADQTLANDIGVILSSSVDDFAIQVRRGELPPALAYSSVGKILFPFFTFTAGTNQKILRQTYNAGGVTAVAIMMAHQAPVAVLVASAANVMDGKDWDDDVLKRAVGIAPGIGYGAFAYSAFDRGEIGSTPTVWAAPNAAASIADGLVNGDVNKILKNTPFISASPILQTLNASLKD